MNQFQFWGLLFSVAMFAACSQSSTDGGVDGTPVSSTSVSTVETIVNETERTISTYEGTCVYGADSSYAVFDAHGLSHVLNYSIFGDTLELTIDSGVTRATGNASGSVYGTWDVLDQQIPTKLVISEASMVLSADWSNYCYADTLAALYSALYAEYDLDISVTASDCNHFSSKGPGGTVEFYVSMNLYELSIVARVNGRTCTNKATSAPVSEETCTIENMKAGLIPDSTHYVLNDSAQYNRCLSGASASSKLIAEGSSGAMRKMLSWTRRGL